MKEILIIGCGGHSKSIMDTILNQHLYEDILLIDENAKHGEKILGFNVKGLKDVNFDCIDKDCIIAIGDNSKREKIFTNINKNNIVSIISSLSYVSKFSEIKIGTFIANNVCIGPEVKIGFNSIINTGSIIEHEVTIGNHVHIGPNSTLCGRTIIKNNVFVGAGVTVKDKITIEDNVIVGAGAVVINNLFESGTYVGIPARRIK